MKINFLIVSAIIGLKFINGPLIQLDVHKINNIISITNIQTDTLILRDSILVYPGKRIALLGGKWKKQRYYSIGLNSSLSFQGMFLRNLEIKNNREYQENQYLFEADRTVSALYNVKEVTLIKVERSGNNKRGYSDMAYFKVKGTKFRCNLNMGLDSSEIRIDYNN
ncbi:MAG: hypothetical protein K2X26_04315 [Chitinophagaceae bacterium]|nr:hypothetical protein [Chitinophagaceae bacterium]